jgi:proline dehydrogenase
LACDKAAVIFISNFDVIGGPDALRHARGAAAARVARELHDRGAGSSIDQFGELVQDAAIAGQVTASYLRLADQVNTLPADTWLSVDLSHLGLDVDPPACADHLAAIAARLSPGRRIQVGAEDYGRADAVLTCVEAVASRGLAGRLGATAEANFRRIPHDLDRLIEVPEAATPPCSPSRRNRGAGSPR